MMEPNEGEIAQSLVRGVERNPYWPFPEGVYVDDQLQPWAAAGYTLIAICLDNPSASDDFEKCLADYDECLACHLRELLWDFLKSLPPPAILQKGDVNSRIKRLNSYLHQGVSIVEKQMPEKRRAAERAIQDWIQQYLEPARGEFLDKTPMIDVINAYAGVHLILVPLAENPPQPFPPQAIWKDGKPAKEWINFLQFLTASTGISDPGSWEALREREFYKALGMTREVAREKTKQAKATLDGIKCHSDWTMLKKAYCFKRVRIDGAKEKTVALELQNAESKRKEKHRKGNPSENDVSKYIADFDTAFDWCVDGKGRSVGRPSIQL